MISAWSIARRNVCLSQRSVAAARLTLIRLFGVCGFIGDLLRNETVFFFPVSSYIGRVSAYPPPAPRRRTYRGVGHHRRSDFHKWPMTQMTQMLFFPQSVLKREIIKTLGEKPRFGHFGHKIETPTHSTLQLPVRLSFQPRSRKRLASNLLVRENRMPFSCVHCW